MVGGALALRMNEVCYKVSLCEYCQQKSCKTFTGLCIPICAKWFVGDVPFYLKFWLKLTNPLQKRQFPIDIRWEHVSRNT